MQLLIEMDREECEVEVSLGVFWIAVDALSVGPKQLSFFA